MYTRIISGTDQIPEQLSGDIQVKLAVLGNTWVSLEGRSSLTREIRGSSLDFFILPVYNGQDF